MPDTQNSNKENNTGTQKKEKIAVSEAIRLKKTNRNVAFACVLILGFAVVLSAGGFVAAMIGKDTVETPQEHIHACSSWQDKTADGFRRRLCRGRLLCVRRRRDRYLARIEGRFLYGKNDRRGYVRTKRNEEIYI